MPKLPDNTETVLNVGLDIFESLVKIAVYTWQRTNTSNQAERKSMSDMILGQRRIIINRVKELNDEQA